MITHHGWRVSVCDVVPSASLSRPWAPAPKQHDDFDVLQAAIDCCRALHQAGRIGIALAEIHHENGVERLRPLNWAELIAT